MSLTFLFHGRMIHNGAAPAAESETAPADLRSRIHAPQPEARDDLAERLRAADGSAPVARTLILEAAAEIERLRGAIRSHRDEVWGNDAPDHVSDAALYRAIDPA